MLAASSKIEKYLRRAGYTHIRNCFIIDKSMPSLSSCHPGVLFWMANMLNIVFFYGAALFEQLINIARFIGIYQTGWEETEPMRQPCLSGLSGLRGQRRTIAVEYKLGRVHGGKWKG